MNETASKMSEKKKRTMKAEQRAAVDESTLSRRH